MDLLIMIQSIWRNLTTATAREGPLSPQKVPEQKASSQSVNISPFYTFHRASAAGSLSAKNGQVIGLLPHSVNLCKPARKFH